MRKVSSTAGCNSDNWLIIVVRHVKSDVEVGHKRMYELYTKFCLWLNSYKRQDEVMSDNPKTYRIFAKVLTS
jgi:hypothetical protein